METFGKPAPPFPNRKELKTNSRVTPSPGASIVDRQNVGSGPRGKQTQAGTAIHAPRR